jgi:gliding motility-associated-like protein
VPNISPVAFLVDRCENVYVSGWGGTLNAYQSAGTFGMPLTPDAYQNTTDGADFYFFVLKKNATQQLYGSFFGRDGGLPDHVDGGTSRFDQSGVIYQGICAQCGNLGGSFPTTGNAWARTKPSSANCNLAMMKMEFNLAGVGGGVQSAINGVPRDTAGCVPLTVDFTDTIANAVSYEWYFNYVPGNPPDLTTLIPSASFTYNAVGLYRVMLVAIDPNTCNVRDSSFTTIKVGDLRATVDWQETKLLPCDSFTYRFDNLSVAPPVRPFGSQSFVWDFGDGSPRIVTGPGPVVHNFPGQGTYNVTLLLQDTAYCNTPDSLQKPVSVAENVIASFTTAPIGCVPYTAIFDNSATVAGQTYEWDFGDGIGTSTQSNPTYIYTAAGHYRIRFIAFNPNTCNGSDTAYFDIDVYDNPVADFSWGPNPPVVNTPVTFTNNSSPDAVRFRWDFGDGDSLLTTSRLPVQHLYNATGTFNACLRAYNAQDCFDDTCMPVTAMIVPLIDVPNAFTPQSGNINSVVMPRGFGISKIQFIIWNRWGQKVFETNSRNQGWDGKVKGTLQPMDVYAYTLYVEFFDGTKTTKKGDITLIR